MEPIQEEVEINQDSITDISIQVVNTTLPTKRLARRAKLWSISSGFSINGVEDLEQLMFNLQNSNDPTLISLADADRGNFENWPSVTALLNDKEGQIGVSRGNDENLSEFHMEVKIAFTLITGEIIDKFILINVANTIEEAAAAIQNIILEHYEISQEEVLGRFFGLDSLHHQIFECVGKDLGFAEDIILYQEELLGKLTRERNSLNNGLVDMNTKLTNAINENKRLNDEFKKKIVEARAEAKAEAKAEEQRDLSSLHNIELSEKMALFKKEKAELITQHEIEKSDLIAQHKLETAALTKQLHEYNIELQNSSRFNSNISHYEAKCNSLEEQLERASQHIDKLTAEIKFLNEQLTNKTGIESCYIFAPDVKGRISGSGNSNSNSNSNSNNNSFGGISTYEFRPPPLNQSNINHSNNSNNSVDGSYNNPNSNSTNSHRPSLSDFDRNNNSNSGNSSGRSFYDNFLNNSRNNSINARGQSSSDASHLGGGNNVLEDYFDGRVHVNTTFVSPMQNFNSNMSSNQSVSSVSSYGQLSKGSRNDHPLRQALRSTSAQKMRQSNDGLAFSFGTKPNSSQTPFISSTSTVGSSGIGGARFRAGSPNRSSSPVHRNISQSGSNSSNGGVGATSASISNESSGRYMKETDTYKKKVRELPPNALKNNSNSGPEKSSWKMK